MVEETLWREYRLTRDNYFRDKLVLRYLKYARHLARKKPIPRRVDRSDIECAAFAGLVQAVERYDPAQPISFTSWAWKRIEGAMQDRLRQIYRWRSGRKSRGVEHELESWYKVRAPESDPAARLERAESFERFLSLFCRNEREREMARLYYQEGLPLRQIGEHFGLTESRACQILKVIERRGGVDQRGGIKRRMGIERRIVTVQVADEIRRRYARGGVTQGELASEFGISPSHVQNLIKWRRKIDRRERAKRRIRA